MTAFSMTGFKAAFKTLREIQKDLTAKDSATYRAAGKEVERSIDANFAAEGRPRWKSRKDNDPHPILDLTGRMKDDALMSTRVWQVSSSSHKLEIRTPEYGLKHQYGQKLPKRQFVKFQPAETQAILNVFRKLFGAENG